MGVPIPKQRALHSSELAKHYGNLPQGSSRFCALAADQVLIQYKGDPAVFLMGLVWLAKVLADSPLREDLAAAAAGN